MSITGMIGSTLYVILAAMSTWLLSRDYERQFKKKTRGNVRVEGQR